MLYAKQLLGTIPDDSLTVLDKGFLSAEILHGLSSAGRNRHFIISAKANTTWEVIGSTPDDSVVVMRVSPQARKKCPELPEMWQARLVTVIDQRARKHLLLTSLFDAKRDKAADIAACYTRRWQVETSYREIKKYAGNSAPRRGLCRLSQRQFVEDIAGRILINTVRTQLHRQLVGKGQQLGAHQFAGGGVEAQRQAENRQRADKCIACAEYRCRHRRRQWIVDASRNADIAAVRLCR